MNLSDVHPNRYRKLLSDYIKTNFNGRGRRSKYGGNPGYFDAIYRSLQPISGDHTRVWLTLDHQFLIDTTFEQWADRNLTRNVSYGFGDGKGNACFYLDFEDETDAMLFRLHYGIPGDSDV